MAISTTWEQAAATNGSSRSAGPGPVPDEGSGTADPALIATAFHDYWLEALCRGQDMAVEVMNSWAQARRSFVPRLPEVSPPDQIPASVGLVESAFSSVEMLLSAQRELIATFMQAARPVWAGPEPLEIDLRDLNGRLLEP